MNRGERQKFLTWGNYTLITKKHKQILKNSYTFNSTFKNKLAVSQIFWKIDTRFLMMNLIIQATTSAKNILHSIAPLKIVKFNPEYH